MLRDRVTCINEHLDKKGMVHPRKHTPEDKYLVI